MMDATDSTDLDFRIFFGYAVFPSKFLTVAKAKP